MKTRKSISSRIPVGLKDVQIGRREGKTEPENSLLEIELTRAAILLFRWYNGKRLGLLK